MYILLMSDMTKAEAAVKRDGEGIANKENRYCKNQYSKDSQRSLWEDKAFYWGIPWRKEQQQ